MQREGEHVSAFVVRKKHLSVRVCEEERGTVRQITGNRGGEAAHNKAGDTIYSTTFTPKASLKEYFAVFERYPGNASVYKHCRPLK